jgi:hypothetical protein
MAALADSQSHSGVWGAALELQMVPGGAYNCATSTCFQLWWLLPQIFWCLLSFSNQPLTTPVCLTSLWCVSVFSFLVPRLLGSMTQPQSSLGTFMPLVLKAHCM